MRGCCAPRLRAGVARLLVSPGIPRRMPLLPGGGPAARLPTLGAAGGQQLGRLAERRRCFSAAAGAASADELQALAARLVNDRALAERLAASAEAPALLLSAAEGKDGVKSESVPRPDESQSTADSFQQRLITDAPPPTRRQMKIYAAQHFVPFVGFGFCDNFIMILAGDFIDARLGVTLGITTMAAAGIGNTLSDVCGLWLSGIIETVGAALGLPQNGLTNEQRGDIRMMMLKNSSMVSGMVLGCIMGMVPLLYPEEYRLWESRTEVEEKRRKEAAT